MAVVESGGCRLGTPVVEGLVLEALLDGLGLVVLLEGRAFEVLPVEVVEAASLEVLLVKFVETVEDLLFYTNCEQKTNYFSELIRQLKIMDIR